MSQITVTIGQIPGRPAQELSLDQGATIADAIARSGLSTNGYEIRVNNVPTRELNTPLSDEDFVSLVQSIKGNYGELLEITAIVVENKKKGKTHKFTIAQGSLLVAVKSLLSLPGKFADYEWTVGSAENCEKSFVLEHDATIKIIKKTAKKVAKKEEKPIKAEKTPKKAEKKTDVSETMEVSVSINGGERFVKTLPRRARVSALLKELGYASLKELKSMVINGKTVTLTFFEIKAGADVEITVEETKTDSAPKPDEFPTKKPTKKVLKKVVKKTEKAEKTEEKAPKKTEKKAVKKAAKNTEESKDIIHTCNCKCDEANLKPCPPEVVEVGPADSPSYRSFNETAYSGENPCQMREHLASFVNILTGIAKDANIKVDSICFSEAKDSYGVHTHGEYNLRIMTSPIK